VSVAMERAGNWPRTDVIPDLTCSNVIDTNQLDGLGLIPRLCVVVQNGAGAPQSASSEGQLLARRNTSCPTGLTRSSAFPGLLARKSRSDQGCKERRQNYDSTLKRCKPGTGETQCRAQRVSALQTRREIGVVWLGKLSKFVK
jgi:hypothetical protein